MRSTHLLFALLFATAAQVASAAPQSVRIEFIEALAPRDTTSSERFQRDFEGAIRLATMHLEKRAASCGYRFKTATAFYDASDPLQAKERAARADQNGTWLIVGPRRSNHYLLLAQGAASTPSVSLMATATEVTRLGPLHLSLAPSNETMAKIAARETSRRFKGRHGLKVAAVISDDCVACKDFADHFEREASRLGIRTSSKSMVSGELPETTTLVEKLRSEGPEIVLLPNYSKLTSHLIAAIQPALPKVLFVGSDGWGDSRFGFVQNGKAIESAKGLTVRAFPPTVQGLSAFRLGREIQGLSEGKALSGPSVGILKIMETATELLCQSRPKTREAFSTQFAAQGRKKLAAPWGVSTYELSGGDIRFMKRIGSRE